jgi:hypothetical protein
MGTHSRLRVEGEWGGAIGDLPLIDPALVAYPDMSYTSRSPALNQARPEIGTRFQPGQETASVLQITRRPRLRPKDVSHRQSLGNSEQSSSSFVTPARNFMVNLTFGARRVSLYGNIHTSVDEIMNAAGNIAEVDPSLILLVSGEFILRRGTLLRDYPSTIGPTGMSIMVTTSRFRLTTPVTPPTGPTLPLTIPRTLFLCCSKHCPLWNPS